MKKRLRTMFPMASEFTSGLAWRITVAATGTLLLVVLATPFLSAGAHGVLRAAFSTVCHQLPERTMTVAGVPLVVCSRCLGIYAGLFVGVLLFPFGHRWDGLLNGRAGYVLLLGLAVPGIDWLAGLTGVWESGHLVRAFTGSVFGVVSGYFLGRAAETSTRARTRRPVPEQSPR